MANQLSPLHYVLVPLTVLIQASHHLPGCLQGPLPLSWPPSLHSVGRLPVSLGLEPMDLWSLLSCSPPLLGYPVLGHTLLFACIRQHGGVYLCTGFPATGCACYWLCFPLIPVPGTEPVFSGVGRVYIPLTELLPT